MTDAPAEGDPVDDNEVLYRRVTAMQVDSEGRPNSAAFLSKGHADGVSTAAASLVSREDCLVGGKPGMGLVSVTAGQARAAGAVVYRDAQDASHVLLVLGNGARKVSKQISRVAQPVPGFRPTAPVQAEEELDRGEPADSA